MEHYNAKVDINIDQTTTTHHVKLPFVPQKGMYLVIDNGFSHINYVVWNHDNQRFELRCGI